MVKHYIIMSSSYIDGTRIALDITGTLNAESIKVILRKIKKICGDDVPLSSHFIGTKSDTWESVKEYDPYFDGVVCIDSVADFSEKIKKSRVLSGLNVATYILSKLKCTHLSLEKLVYFAYADYLCSYSDRLFEDKIYAFQHGPVIASVYEVYKRSGYEYVEPFPGSGDIRDEELSTTIGEMPIRSRILFAKNGADKVGSIDRTIKRYGGYTARELVSLTHREGSPWSRVDSSKPYQIISDELIMKYHHVECVE